MQSGRFDPRFVVVVVLLLSTALLLQARSRREIIAPRQSLANLSHSLGPWTGTDMTLDVDTLRVLGPGDFLLRRYENSAPVDVPVDLFVAYFPSQRAGDTIHSPKHCLPGAGWRPVSATRVSLSLPGRESFPANRYLLAHGEDRELVVYWYQAHGREVASEYWAKFYLIADAMRMNRTDGSLVRLSTPLVGRERPENADARVMAFASQLVPLLENYVPR